MNKNVRPLLSLLFINIIIIIYLDFIQFWLHCENIYMRGPRIKPDEFRELLAFGKPQPQQRLRRNSPICYLQQNKIV